MTTAKKNEDGTDKTPSLVEVCHQAWVAAGKKIPTSADNKKLVGAYNAARKAKETAKAAYEKAQAAESDTVKAIIVANGKGKLKINGETMLPMSSAKTVWFRGEGTGEVRDIG